MLAVLLTAPGGSKLVKAPFLDTEKLWFVLGLPVVPQAGSEQENPVNSPEGLRTGERGYLLRPGSPALCSSPPVQNETVADATRVVVGAHDDSLRTNEVGSRQLWNPGDRTRVNTAMAG